MTDRPKWTSFIGLIALVGVVLLMAQLTLTPRQVTLSWNEMKDLVRSGEVEEVFLEGDMVRAQKAEVEGEPQVPVTSVRVPGDEEFIKLLDEQNIKYRAVSQRGCGTAEITLMLVPLSMVFLFWLFLANRGGGGQGVAAFGRSSAKLAPEEGTGVTFADVAGVDEAAEELREVVAFLQTPERFTRLGGRPPKGVLLVGPPGTGKTLLARAVAGEAGVPFLSISGSDFVEMFVGVGAARVRDLFKTAQEHAPCIIFIDELDAVGKSRGAGGPAGNEEREQTLNQMLVEMDGFDNRSGIIVMASTNRPEILDNALLRPGRFDRQVLVDHPDRAGRVEILKVHAKKLKLSEAVVFEEIARLTPGFAGADLANALNEAALLAARRDAAAIEMEDIKEAIERVVAGLEKKSRRMSEFEVKNTAYHEVGHALCAAAMPGGTPVEKISIVPRGMALGYTLYVPAEDRYTQTKAELQNRLVAAYGGRAAEELIFGDVTNGASQDIKQATQIARNMVLVYGMSNELGKINYTSENNNPFGLGGGSSISASPEIRNRIDREIREITDQAYQQALDILIDNRLLLEEITLRLLETEVLDGEELQSYLKRVRQADSLAEPPTAEWLREDYVEDVVNSES